MQEPRERLCFALDVPAIDKALDYVQLLSRDVGIFKVGLELFLREGPQCIEAVRSSGAQKIFLDVKLFDIPRTVRSACQAAAALDVDFVSVHVEGLSSAAQWRLESTPAKPVMLGVTLLTSIGAKDLPSLGYRFDLCPRDIVLLRAELAKAAGCTGVVCGAGEIASVRARCGPDFVILTPGIRPQWASVSGDDQQRVVSPYQAIVEGADYIVVGRPIRDADDPVLAARKVCEEISQALKQIGKS